MALANFFDKVNLGASQLLKTHDRSDFETKLLSNCICLYYGTVAIKTFEGRVALDLLTRLLSRLYPNLKFTNAEDNGGYCTYKEQMKNIAREINPVINLDDSQEETFVICVGDIVMHPRSPIPTFYVGSGNWKAYHSTTRQQNLGNSQNPFGAASAACLACANLFRALFYDEL